MRANVLLVVVSTCACAAAPAPSGDARVVSLASADPMAAPSAPQASTQTSAIASSASAAPSASAPPRTQPRVFTLSDILLRTPDPPKRAGPTPPQPSVPGCDRRRQPLGCVVGGSWSLGYGASVGLEPRRDLPPNDWSRAAMWIEYVRGGFSICSGGNDFKPGPIGVFTVTMHAEREGDRPRATVRSDTFDAKTCDCAVRKLEANWRFVADARKDIEFFVTLTEKWTFIERTGGENR